MGNHPNALVFWGVHFDDTDLPWGDNKKFDCFEDWVAHASGFSPEQPVKPAGRATYDSEWKYAEERWISWAAQYTAWLTLRDAHIDEFTHGTKVGTVGFGYDHEATALCIERTLFYGDDWGINALPEHYALEVKEYDTMLGILNFLGDLDGASKAGWWMCSQYG